jgi:hypothetical protein
MPSVSLENLAAMLGGSARRGQRGRSSMLMTQAAAPMMSGTATRSAAGADLPGDTNEDLFVYDLGRLDLVRGERVYVPLSDQTVRHEHRFDWTLPDTIKDDRFQRDAPQEEPPVWHVLKLENDSSAPWTTAPILVIGEQGPMAQSTLRYTPPRGDVRVQLTQALDIAGTAREVRADEGASQHETVQLFGQRYERVIVKGRLELNNLSRRDVPMHVVKALSGDIAQADGDPVIEARAAGLGDVNANRTMTWDFELKAGAEWAATYRYEVLIRR